MESFAGQESIAQWTQHQWLEEWKKSRVPPHSLPPSKVGNPDLGLSRSAWCKLNHLRTRVGRLLESLHRWQMADPWCPCGSEEAQTVEYILSGRCDSIRMPGANADLASPLPALGAWLEKNDLAVQSYARRRRHPLSWNGLNKKSGLRLNGLRTGVGSGVTRGLSQGPGGQGLVEGGQLVTVGVPLAKTQKNVKK